MLKHLGLGFLMVVLVGCASVPYDEPIDIYQKTRTYSNRSFDDVWQAALRSVNEMEFIVRNATKKIGLIHAEANRNPDSRYLPPLMNIIIAEEEGKIIVNFHIELPGQRNNTGIRRDYTDQFFKALRKNLK